MPCQLLVNATAHSKALKGEILAIFDDPHTWGGREGLPDYVVVRIPNATKAQVEGYLDKWLNTPNYDVGVPVLGRLPITVTMPARVLSEYAGKGFKAHLKKYLESDWGATVTVVDPNSLYIVDVPEATDLQALKSGVLDQFEEEIGPRYIFDPVRVDQAVAAGGDVTRTKAQAQADIIDRAV